MRAPKERESVPSKERNLASYFAGGEPIAQAPLGLCVENDLREDSVFGASFVARLAIAKARNGVAPKSMSRTAALMAQLSPRLDA